MIPCNAYEVNQARILHLQEGIHRDRLADIAKDESANAGRLVKLIRPVRHLIGDQPASGTDFSGELASLPARE